MTNDAFAEQMKTRSKNFAVMTIKFLDTIKETPAMRVIRFQLIKSVTSAAANYRAVCRARSDKEFFAKMSIVVEETDETLFWLEMLQELNLGDQSNRNQLLKEATELVSIYAKTRKTIGQKLKNH